MDGGGLGGGGSGLKGMDRGWMGGLALASALALVSTLARTARIYDLEHGEATSIPHLINHPSNRSTTTIIPPGSATSRQPGGTMHSKTVHHTGSHLCIASNHNATQTWRRINHLAQRTTIETTSTTRGRRQSQRQSQHLETASRATMPMPTPTPKPMPIPPRPPMPHLPHPQSTPLPFALLLHSKPQLLPDSMLHPPFPPASSPQFPSLPPIPHLSTSILKLSNRPQTRANKPPLVCFL